MTILKDIEKLILATKINDKVIDNSTIIDEKTKEAFKNLSKYTRDILEKNPKINSYGLNSLKGELLTYWNETITPDTENFWTELEVNDIKYERKKPLIFALEKKRFKRVEHGIDARKYWSGLKKSREITDQFTTTEIEQIETIIIQDENKRLEILKKCLRKNEIPQTQYLKFGECMAYMDNCGIWNKHFNNEEVQDLYNMWTNFNSK